MWGGFQQTPDDWLWLPWKYERLTMSTMPLKHFVSEHRSENQTSMSSFCSLFLFRVVYKLDSIMRLEIIASVEGGYEAGGEDLHKSG